MNANRYRWADDYPSYGRAWMGDVVAIGTVLFAVVLISWWRPLAWRGPFIATPQWNPRLTFWEHSIATVVFTVQIVLLVCYLAIEWRLRTRERDVR